MKLDPIFRGKKTVGTNGAKRRRSPKPAPAVPAAPAPPPVRSSNTGTSRSVELKSGGTLTISATLDLFALNAADRKFVFDLIDKLEGYEEEG